MKDVVCFKCGQRGHFKVNCQAKKVDSTKQQQKHCSFTVLGATDCDLFDRTKWCLDSGATAHMCCDRKLFSNFAEHTELIALAGDNNMCAEGKGDVKLVTNMCLLTLKDVLYVPSMRGNFISVSRAVEMGCAVMFGSEFATIKQNGEEILRVRKNNRLYMLDSERSGCFGAVQCDAVN